MLNLLVICRKRENVIKNAARKEKEIIHLIYDIV